jgi:hydrogenase small subunit
VRWDLHDETPSGWARHASQPGAVQGVGHRFYDRLRRSTDTAKGDTQPWGKRAEWTEARDPDAEDDLRLRPETGVAGKER